MSEYIPPSGSSFFMPPIEGNSPHKVGISSHFKEVNSEAIWHDFEQFFANFSYQDLYNNQSLSKLDQYFLLWLEGYSAQRELNLTERLLAYRTKKNFFSAKEESEFLILLAIALEDFLALFFNLTANLAELKNKINLMKPISMFRRNIIQRKFARLPKSEVVNLLQDNSIKSLADLQRWLNDSAQKQQIELPFDLCALQETKFSELEGLIWEQEFITLYESKPEFRDCLEKLALMLMSEEFQALLPTKILLHIFHSLDFKKLLDLQPLEDTDIKKQKLKNKSPRDGFSFGSKHEIKLDKALLHTDYCIFCHNQEKDSCRKGIIDPQQPEKFKLSYGNEELTGCPLEERISEMNFLFNQGNILGAFAVIIIDNPMVAGTGHRICNECMKSCIYQKQEPVNIPLIETIILDTILHLPMGFEIYSLLTKWNPLKSSDYLPKNPTNKRVLVVGSGPAGYTLAHYLLNEGHSVVMIEGLKINQFRPEYAYSPLKGAKIIDDISYIEQDAEEREVLGFGGVSEYGITNRWDKNYLSLIYLLLMRRESFKLHDSVRFGSQITLKSAFFQFGFDHIALAIGAGVSKNIPIKNNLIKGVRMASEFLMTLQLLGAYKKSSLNNLQIQMPIVVIGGGLTAVDTACEASAYYIRQVEKLTEFMIELQSYEASSKELFTSEDYSLLLEFIRDAFKFLRERVKALKERRKPNFIRAINELGGVSLCYRQTIQESPAYRYNYEELKYALAEGIIFSENLLPLEFKADVNGNLASVIFLESETKKIIEIPAKTALIATGLGPNMHTFVDAEITSNLQESFSFFNEDNSPIMAEELAKLAKLTKNSKQKHGFIIKSYQVDGTTKYISAFGDINPSFTGNVVKAMASSKQGYKTISSLLNKISNKN